MNQRAGRWLPPALAAAALLAACGEAAQRPANPVSEQAESLESDAGRAYARLDYDTARRNFAAAAQARTSIDDRAGAAQDRINEARALAALGKSEAARAQLEALSDAAALLPPPLAAEIARQLAVLALADGQAAAAQRWQQRAAAACGADCPLVASLALIRTQIALRAGDIATAASELAAAQALLANATLAGAEHANAARLAGEIEMQRKNFAQARSEFERALELDRSLGAGPRVRLDLRLLAEADEALADLPAARSRYRRLREAAEAGGDSATAAAARSALQRLGM